MPSLNVAYGTKNSTGANIAALKVLLGIDGAGDLQKIKEECETIALNVAITALGYKLDDTVFTPTATVVNVIAGEVDDVAPSGVTEGNRGAVRMSGARSLHVLDDNGAGILAKIIAAPATEAKQDDQETTLDAILAAMGGGLATSALQTTQETSLDAIEILVTASNVDLAAIEVLITAGNVDLAALEVDMAALEVDVAALEALGITIDADTGAIKTATEAVETLVTAGNADLAAIEVLITAGNVKLAALEVDMAALEVDVAALEVIANTIDGDTGAIKNAVQSSVGWGEVDATVGSTSGTFPSQALVHGCMIIVNDMGSTNTVIEIHISNGKVVCTAVGQGIAWIPISNANQITVVGDGADDGVVEYIGV